jgi:starch synthase (maltosyl-transferring)
MRRDSTTARNNPIPLTNSDRLPSTARRVVIERLCPQIDAGRFPIKRTPGERVTVLADIFADGHDVLAAVLRDRPVPAPHARRGGLDEERSPVSPPSEAPSGSGEPGTPWRETAMSLVGEGLDEWSAGFEVAAIGWHEYQVVAWIDRFATWQRNLLVKARAAQDVSVELLEGALLVRETAARADQIGAGRADALWLMAQADALMGQTTFDAAAHGALSPRLTALMHTYASRSEATTSATLRAWVDRVRARFGAWYEMFPRSVGSTPTRGGTFGDASTRLRSLSDLGFDIVYLPPIHPIGTTFRKGPNNNPVAQPGDPGSPWAIGSEAGGHTAVEPGLGTVDDFDAFRREAERLGLEVALDLAWQCSPDHPWVREHPEWFRQRPDGTIKYAENPPKRYQDIYPLDFTCEDWRALWQALLEVTLFWVDRGVKMFRVDNPHTKTFAFWEWLIAEVRAHDPNVFFLSEAFTRPKPMRYLAKTGFSQSYTYFTWRNTKAELIDYFTELTTTEVREYLRPNLFANTPDILHAHLQQGGRPAFEARLILAATLGASYGIYSGFELCEARAVAGTEEYADSEKYQYRQWDWDRPGNILNLIARVNAIRRRHRALQFDHTVAFVPTDNPELIAYTKSPPDRPGHAAWSEGATLLVVVNLDPFHTQHGFVNVPIEVITTLGDQAAEGYLVRDLLDDTAYVWRGERNYVRLDPGVRQAHVFQLEPRQ